MFKGSFSLVQLTSFAAVAKWSSFTKAADELGISKSAISQNIKQLESMTKADLVIRTTRKVELTTEGQKLLEQCHRLENEWFGIKQLISSFDQHPEGELVISTNNYFAQERLSDVIKRYLQLYPKVGVSLLIEERMPDLYHENIDIVFGVNWAPSEDVVAQKLMSTAYVICASPTYLHQRGVPKTVAQLQMHDFIPHGERKQMLVGDGVLSDKNRWVTRLKVNNIDCMKRFALDGLGIIQAHRYMVEAEIKKGLLMEIKLVDLLALSVEINMYYQKHQYVQPKVKTFVDLVKQMF